MPAGVDEKKIKVVIVDDHVLVRSGLEVVFGMFDDIELAGQAGDGDEAVQLCRELQPDVVLMDLVMPGTLGRRGHAADPRHVPRHQGRRPHELHR